LCKVMVICLIVFVGCAETRIKPILFENIHIACDKNVRKHVNQIKVWSDSIDGIEAGEVQPPLVLPNEDEYLSIMECLLNYMKTA
jgi:hypothetical protein